MSKVKQILTALEPAIKAVKAEGGGGELTHKVVNGFFKQKQAECKALETELINTPGAIVEKKIIKDDTKNITAKSIKGTHPEYGDFDITITKAGDVLEKGKISTEKTTQVVVKGEDVFTLKKSKWGDVNSPTTEKQIVVGDRNGYIDCVEVLNKKHIPDSFKVASYTGPHKMVDKRLTCDQEIAVKTLAKEET
ncbi:MAG: hypothetical protein QE263_10130 [Vampirovibrionales bacterium]|nr:hypothetical protein [Vampirovibrionales bacterium]